MELGLKDKVVLITGSSKGIGKGIALAFAGEGARVVVTGRNQKNVLNTISMIEETYGQGKAFGFSGNLLDEANLFQCVKNTINKWDGIDILIANLGSGKGKTGWEIGESEWNRLLNINLAAGVKAAEAAIPWLIKSSTGNIIFISSIAGLESLGASPPYEAAKSAINSYSKHLSRELASQGVRVNVIAPGNILFPESTWDRKLQAGKEEILKLIEREVPMNRFGEPQDVASAALFLASQKAAFITGACLTIDGGQTRSFF